MTNVYILKLESGKYYVGKTDNPKVRIDNHFNSNGSAWTRKYKPVKVVDIITDCDDFDEDKYTQIYMRKYGINNVRGGSFCQIKLSNGTRTVLKKIMNTAMKKCYNCGIAGHFITECKTAVSDSDTSDDDDACYRTSYYANNTCHINTK